MKRSLLFAISAQAITIAILLLLAARFFNQVISLKEYTGKVEHTYLVINRIFRVQSAIRDAETSSRGFLLTGDADFIRQLKESSAELMPQKDSLRRLVYDNPKQMVLLKRIDTLAYEKVFAIIENTRIKRRISIDSINRRLAAGKYLMDSIDIYMDKMQANEFELLKEHKQLKNKYEVQLPHSVQVAFFITGFLTIFFGFWIFVELKKRFRSQSILQVKLAELRQNNEELEQIAFAASHDLQEPLRKIRIFSDRLLLKTQKSEGYEKYQMIQRMNFAAARLQDLIADLVTFNQLVQNKTASGNIDLRAAINAAIESLMAKAPGTIVHISQKEEYPVVRGSEDQIQILLQEIFDNAVEFKSPERPLTIDLGSLKVSWSQIKGLPSDINAGHFFRISIRDNGIGFDETFKDKMFKPFQRLHNIETENNTRRKGMGLAMCKRVMLNLGGWIDAEGKVGEGAVIRLYFPVT